MKLFKSLLVAPATIGLLTPLPMFAGEANLNEISKYSDLEQIDLANAFVNDQPKYNSLLAGGEGLVDSYSPDGGFSETTTASFSVDAALGAIDGDTTSEKTFASYQFNIGLSTSFTGEDSLDIAIDSGSDSAATADDPLAFDTGASLQVDGVAYSFPLGGISMLVGFDTDISSAFTGACTYSAFTDYISNCGTDLSYVAGGGVTVAGSYAFDSGFSLAAGVSGQADSTNGLMTKEGEDYYGIEAAYTADSWGVAVAYASDDNAGSAETTYWGVNANYSFDIADVSVGFETEETSGTDKSGYFVGLTFPEVGPGSVSLGAGTSANYADSETEYMIYEASYSYPVNDGMTITPGVFVEEKSGDDLTGIIVKSSFSF
ncbi:porin [Prochlorococcus sp. AH-736-L23]|nr:porin [Prochlorococcus sp. AH-736-L23]